MATLPPVGATVRLNMRWSYGTDANVECRTFWAHSGTSPTGAQLLTWLNSIATIYAATLNSIAPDALTLTELEATDLSSPTAATAAVATADIGGHTGAENSAATATLINFKVARRYRGGKPRIYLPFGQSADLANPQRWSPTWLGEVDTQWGAFHSQVLAAGATAFNVFGQINVSYYEGTVLTGTGTPQDPYKYKPKLRPAALVDNITGFSVSAIPGSQRRRYER